MSERRESLCDRQEKNLDGNDYSIIGSNDKTVHERQQSSYLMTLCCCVAIILVFFSILGVVINSFTNIKQDSPDETSNVYEFGNQSVSCSAKSFLLGDGVCDEVANTEVCLYDKGDCCLKGLESKKYCSDCDCIVKVDEDTLEGYFAMELVHQYQLEHDKQIIDSNIVEASFDNVLSSKVCSTLCIFGLDSTSNNVNSWVFNPTQKTCYCIEILQDYQCRQFYGSQVFSLRDTDRASAFIKTSEVVLRNDCTERFLLVGGLTSNQDQNEFVNLENALSGPCSYDSSILNEVKLNGKMTGGVSDHGQTIIACGGYDIAECLVFTRNETLTHQLSNIRYKASSVFLKSGLLYVTGGVIDKDADECKTIAFCMHDSSELIHPLDGSMQGPTLPEGMANHCMVDVKDGDEVVVLTSEFVYKFDPVFMEWSLTGLLSPWLDWTNDQFAGSQTALPSIVCGKVYPGDEWIVVSGISFIQGLGISKRNFVSKDTWVLQLSNMEWLQGPALPQKVCFGAMVASSDGKSIFMLGGKHSEIASESLTTVFKFRCHNKQLDTCQWHQMEQRLKYPRHTFLAFRIPLEQTPCDDVKIDEGEDNLCFHEHLFMVGDGFCDDVTNSILCRYDGGDCCFAAIDDHFCTSCICHVDNEKHNVWTSTTQIPLSKDCPKGLSEISGDGFCDDDANIPVCSYDGNDCCAIDGATIPAFCWYCQCHSDPNEDQIVPYYAQCPFQQISEIEDNFCDDEANNVACAFDGNNCCFCGCLWENPDHCKKCKCHLDVTEFNATELDPAECSFHEIVADGICDDISNSQQCLFDGMDCCNDNDIYEPVLETANCYFCRCHLTVTEGVNSLPEWIEMHSYQ